MNENQLKINRDELEFLDELDLTKNGKYYKTVVHKVILIRQNKSLKKIVYNENQFYLYRLKILEVQGNIESKLEFQKSMDYINLYFYYDKNSVDDVDEEIIFILEEASKKIE